MLSRVADALYWMGRYLERAENATRLLLVTEDLSAELGGLHRDLAAAEWQDLLAVFPGSVVVGGDGPPALAHLHAFLKDAGNPYSVASSLRRARDNARSAREALTLEVFLNLNEAHRELDARGRRELRDLPSVRSVLSATQKAVLSIVGAIDHTLSRDQSWLFLKLGESLERAFRTAFVLRAKLPALLGSEARGPRVDVELQYTRCRGLLRAVSSLENYRQAHGARLEPTDVVRFLLFDPDAPRALRHGTAAVRDHLERMVGSNGLTPPLRLVSKLLARLAYDAEEVVVDRDTLAFLDHALAELAKTHDAIAAEYFTS